jgi:hypothetical protein
VDATERELRGGGETKPLASRNVEIIVASLPSDLALPSWVQEGMTKQQVRSRMSGTPVLDRGNMIGYSGPNRVFSFSESGGLISYGVLTRTNLNAVLNSFRKTIGREPVKSKMDDGDDQYSWLAPSQIRDGLVILHVIDNGSGNVSVIYSFTFLL